MKEAILIVALIFFAGCSATYRGFVKDSNTGSPIADARVEGRYTYRNTVNPIKSGDTVLVLIFSMTSDE